MAGFDVVHSTRSGPRSRAPGFLLLTQSGGGGPSTTPRAPTLAGRTLRTLVRLLSRLLLPHVSAILSPRPMGRRTILLTNRDPGSCHRRPGSSPLCAAG